MVELDDVKERVNKLIAELKQEYGELRVQSNLAKREAADELHALGEKLKKLEGKAKELGGATADAAGDIGAAAKLLGEEIRDGIKDIAKKF